MISYSHFISILLFSSIWSNFVNCLGCWHITPWELFSVCTPSLSLTEFDTRKILCCKSNWSIPNLLKKKMAIQKRKKKEKKIKPAWVLTFCYPNLTCHPVFLLWYQEHIFFFSPTLCDPNLNYSITTFVFVSFPWLFGVSPLPPNMISIWYIVLSDLSHYIWMIFLSTYSYSLPSSSDDIWPSYFPIQCSTFLH